ncbi:MAG: zf-HC2 domain-containing protein [Thermodesulfobacteriota bacterium]|nr:zf-HC2 domain-containing protein [Thermodesulfobacteriota bacterium]
MKEKQKNTCKVKKKITLLLDAELSRKESEFVMEHLKDCPVCQKEYEALKSMDNLLRDLKPVTSSRDFPRQFWQKVEAGEENQKRWRIFSNFGFKWRPALAAAACVAVIAAGSLMSSKSELHPPGMPTNAADIIVAQNFNFYRDYDIINNLELFEHWEEIIKTEEI